MATIKTRPTDADVDEFLAAVPSEQRRADGLRLRATFERITGARAIMWGPSIVGFGGAEYTNTTGTNDWFVVGFSPRKAATTIYGVYDGYAPHDARFDDLGPHTTGKGCLYIKRLDEVDVVVLETLIRDAWERSLG